MTASFSLVEERSPLAAVIAASGEVDVATAAELRTAIAQAQGAGCARVVVDLCAVSFIDTAGLAALLNAWRRTRNGGRLAVACAPGPVLHALKAAGLDGSMPMFVSRDAALDQLAREAGAAVPG
jgi:anti-sigma B factor antagonist